MSASRYFFLLRFSFCLICFYASFPLYAGAMVQEGPAYCTVRFSRSPDPVLLEKLRAAGMHRLLDYLGDNSWLAELENSDVTGCILSLHDPAVLSVDLYTKKDVLARSEAPVRGLLHVYFFPGQAFLYFHQFEVKSYVPAMDRVTVNADSLQDLYFWASLPGVKWIFSAGKKFEALGQADVNSHQAGYYQNPFTGSTLLGDSILLGQFDVSATVEHVDFRGRIDTLGIIYPPALSHATQVCGLIAGAGNKDPKGIGMAPRALIKAYDIYGDIILAMDTASAAGLGVTQNAYAYGAAADSCYFRGKYDDFSADIDRLVVLHPKLVHVVACGNFQAQCGLGGFRTVSSGIQAAKNGIMVGSITVNDSMSNNSSFGPVRDGRLKPELVAAGAGVYSTNPVDAYIANLSGTSYSSAGMSGAVALLQQAYRRKYDSLPNADMVKAMLINAADDMGNPGPDFKYGFGKLNVFKTLQQLELGEYYHDSTGHGEVKYDTITIPAGCKRLKVTLAYTDQPAAPFAGRALVNDIDVRVSRGSAHFYPLIADTANVNLNNVAVQGIDSFNNTEQVVVDTPQGQYVVRISGSRVTGNRQVYALVYNFEFSDLKLTYPVAGETLEPLTGIQVRWNAGHVTDSLKAYYSVDSGMNWLPIDTMVPPSRSFINWVVPDSVTSKGMVKIVTGSLQSVSEKPFHIMKPMADTLANSNCNGIINLYWKKQSQAAKYHIYMLQGTAMQEVGQTTDTMFTVPGLTDSLTYWFALQLESAGGALSRRSLARPVKLNMLSTPAAIVLNPLPDTVCAGQSLQLKARASGSALLTYAWEESLDSGLHWHELAGKTDTVLLFSPLNSSYSGRWYRMKANNSCNVPAFSSPAAVYADTVRISLTPDTATGCSGNKVVFLAEVKSLSAYSITWQQLPADSLNWETLPSDTGLSLELNNLSYLKNRSRYRPLATNACGTANQETSLLLVRKPLQVYADTGLQACKGQMLSVAAMGTGGDSLHYHWKVNGDAITGFPFLLIPQQDMKLYIELSDNCSSAHAYDTVNVKTDQLTGGFSYHIDYQVKNDPKQIKFIPGYTGAQVYRWYFGDGDSAAADSPSHLYPALGSYLVTQYMESSTGCKIIFSDSIHLDGNQQVFTPINNKLIIYPNPSAGSVFYLSLPGADMASAHIEVSDLSGRMLKNIGIIGLKNEICRLNIPDPSAGIYVIKVISGNRLYTGRLVIIRE